MPEAWLHRAEWHLHRGEHADAEAMLDRLTREATAAHGADDPITLPLRSNHVFVLRTLGRFEDALPVLDRLLETHVQRYGAGHPYTLWVHRNHARTLRDAGRLADAEASYRRLLDAFRLRHEADHVDVLRTRRLLAEVLIDRRALRSSGHGAERAARRVAARVGDGGALDAALTDTTLARAQRLDGRADVAAETAAQSVESLLHLTGEPGHRHVVAARLEHARALRTQQRYDDARVIARRAADAAQSFRGTDDHADVIAARLEEATIDLLDGQRHAAIDTTTAILDQLGIERRTRSVRTRALVVRALAHHPTDGRAPFHAASAFLELADAPYGQRWGGSVATLRAIEAMRIGDTETSAAFVADAAARLAVVRDDDDPLRTLVTQWATTGVMPVIPDALLLLEP